MTTANGFYYWPWFEDVEAIVLFICFPIVCLLGERVRGISVLCVFYGVACYCVDLYQFNPVIGESPQLALGVKWTIWALIMMVGSLVACCLLKLTMVLAGATALGLLGNLGYQMILSAGMPDYVYARLIVILVCAVVGALIALKALKIAFQIFTPVIGGYCCVAAVDHAGYFLGWWQSRPFFPRHEPYGQFFSHPDKFPWRDDKHCAGLLVLWAVLTLIGLGVQICCQRRRTKEIIVHETRVVTA